jgi:nitrate reductase cytochrome c-type subunit
MVNGEGSGKTSIIVLLIVILVVGIAAAGITYFYSQQGVDASIQERQRMINALEEDLGNAELEIEKLKSQTPDVTPPDDGTTPVSTGELDCLQCHDIDQHKEFHVPQTIMQIDEAHGYRRRVCIDCHGPNGYDENGNFIGWEADKQMTDFDLINFNPREGENGAFELSNQVVHGVHKRKLDSGILTCQFCHVPPGTTEFVIPEVKSDLGRVLYCQNEGCHDSEGGNYISIHIELRPFKCTTCHTGEIIGVHLPGTSQLGKFEFVNGTEKHIH